MHGFASGGGGYVALIKDGKETCSSEVAAEEVFGLTSEDARYLFNGKQPPPYEMRDKLNSGPDWDATPKEVAKHIRRFVKVKFPD
jgi:hypothetical protein